MVAQVRLVGGLIQEDRVMSEDESLIAVVAHRLTSFTDRDSGKARSQFAVSTAQPDEVDRLLYMAELKALRVTDDISPTRPEVASARGSQGGQPGVGDPHRARRSTPVTTDALTLDEERPGRG